MKKTSNEYISLTCQVTIALILCAGALYILRPIMVPLVLAIMLSYILAPLVDTLIGKFKLPTGIAITAALFITILIIVITGTMISTSIQTLASKADLYQSHIDQLIQQGLHWLEEKGVIVSTEALGALLASVVA